VQQGLALILMVTVLVMGFAWFSVGALSKAAYGTADREARTGRALKRAKEALLAYVAETAASSTELYPGRLPCPEVRSVAGSASVVAGTGNAAYDGKAFDTVYAGFSGPFNTTTTPPAAAPIACDNPAIGRLPWKTLGIEQLRDGSDEPLWYAVANSTGAGLTPWAWINNGDALVINPGTANQLTYDGTANAVVAVIIAPGAIQNTLSITSTLPAGCTRVNQSARYTPPYTVANFLECGNAANSYTTIGTSPWSNDRTISITAGEVMTAIVGAVADRLQRQVAPALASWDSLEATNTGKSWGTSWGTSFLPFASTFTRPDLNDYCGNGGAAPVREGLLPSVFRAPPPDPCSTDWTNATTSGLAGLSLLGGGCNINATNVVCTFTRAIFALGAVTVTADAPLISSTFRGTIQPSDVVVSGSASGTPTKTVTMAVTSNPDRARVTITVGWPLLNTLADFLCCSTATITFPHVADAAVLNDPRVGWFLNNKWHQWTYYQVGSAATLGGAAGCPANCITVNGLPAANGSTSDKRLVLAFMGSGPVGAQVQPGTSAASYLESHTAPSTTYSMQTVTSTFNDRLAMCPFQQTPLSGGPVSICN